MPAPHIVKLRIRGLVQKVGFRMWVERQAGALGVDGWVRNRADGSVEALFSGPPENVRDLIEKCRRGPRGAQVTALELEPVSEREAAERGFVILPTV